MPAKHPVVAEPLEPRICLAAVEITEISDTASSSPTPAITLGSVAIFGADDGETGRELWATDGTTEGTVLLKDIVPWNQESSPYPMARINNVVLFRSYVGGWGLWRTDGTPEGTVLLKQMTPGNAGIYGVGMLGDSYYFVHNESLWKTDGTIDGTVMVDGSMRYQNISLVNGWLYFSGYTSDSGWELWRSDGTVEGKVMVKDIRPGAANGSPSLFTFANGLVFFVASAAAGNTTYLQLWRTDGSTDGTQLVRDFGTNKGPSNLTSVGNRIVFSLWDFSNTTVKTTPWTSDGTFDGTVQLSSNPMTNDLIAANNEAYFVVPSPANSAGIWKTNGTVAGTVMVKPFVTTSTDSLGALWPFEDTLFFSIIHQTSVELWQTGVAGTHLVKGGLRGASMPLGRVNGTLLYSLADRHGLELWKTDDTDAGTQLVKDINTRFISNPVAIKNVNGELFFAAAQQVWKTTGDGVVTSIAQFTTDNFFDENDGAVNLNGRYIFTSKNTRSIWASDGTAQGTVLLKTFQVGIQAGGKQHMIVLGNYALFFAEGNQLWRTDGTPGGTVWVNSFTVSSSELISFMKFGNRAYFATAGNGLYKTDGTFGGTTRLNSNIYSNSNSPPAAVYNNRLYYIAYQNGYVLWSSDGNSAGAPVGGSPQNAERLTVAGENLYFVSGSLYRYNSIAGYLAVKPFVSGKNISNLIDYKGTLFFSVGNELWKSDGTLAGTVMVAQVSQAISQVAPFKIAQGLLFFVVGNEVWKSDGSAAGTAKVADHPAGGQLILDEIGGDIYLRGATPKLEPILYRLGSPVARTSGPYAADVHGTQQLDASGSSDPDPAETLTFSWDLDNDGVFGETGAAAGNGDEIGAAPDFVANAAPAAAYPIKLRVTNSIGLSSETTTSIRIAKIGDLNFDNQVSIADFIQLAAHFNQSPATWEDGDLNGDDVVTIADFIMLASNFGQGFSGNANPEAPLASAAVPVAGKIRRHRSKPHHRVERVKQQPNPVFLDRRLAERR